MTIWLLKTKVARKTQPKRPISQVYLFSKPPTTPQYPEGLRGRLHNYSMACTTDEVYEECW